MFFTRSPTRPAGRSWNGSSDGPAPVKALAEPLAMSLPAVMQHLKVLEDAGVIVTEKIGRVRSCRIEPKTLRDAERWLSGQRTEWERQLDQLDDYLKGK